MKTISKVSRKKPSTNMIAMTTINAPSCPPGICSSIPCTSSPPPIRVKMSAKAVAPSRMMKIIDVIDIVALLVSRITCTNRARSAPVINTATEPAATATIRRVSSPNAPATAPTATSAARKPSQKVISRFSSTSLLPDPSSR